jgi:flagellar protein FlaE
MGINPRDYDLNELREMARERGESPENLGSSAAPDPEEMETPSEASPDDSFRSAMYRELLPLEAGAGDLEKPYLRDVPDNYASEFLVFEWLEFLLMHAGYRGAQDALDYYESIGWITEDVESELSDYLLGIDDVAGDDDALTMNDHLVALTYVAKLASTA